MDGLQKYSGAGVVALAAGGALLYTTESKHYQELSAKLDALKMLAESTAKNNMILTERVANLEATNKRLTKKLNSLSPLNQTVDDISSYVTTLEQANEAIIGHLKTKGDFNLVIPKQRKPSRSSKRDKRNFSSESSDSEGIVARNK
jgi:single-stranded DNA-specific DHH superfamily exonuclease